MKPKLEMVYDRCSNGVDSIKAKIPVGTANGDFFSNKR